MSVKQYIMTPEQLSVRMRRTVTNKFSTTIEPRVRAAVRARAFENDKFCKAVDAAIAELVGITEQVRGEYANKQTEQEQRRAAKREAHKAKAEAKKQRFES